MGGYLRDGNDLYGVTARHSLFPPNEDNTDYTWKPGVPRKEVLLLGTKSLNAYTKSIQVQIGTLHTTLGLVEQRIQIWRRERQGMTLALRRR